MISKILEFGKVYRIETLAHKLEMTIPEFYQAVHKVERQKTATVTWLIVKGEDYIQFDFIN